ncbi:hypothetical protein BGZ74_009965 [Mortierella antarctica]|nr:hypothetical protein BGZ74_009965 [Mortierella antarctica]
MTIGSNFGELLGSLIVFVLRQQDQDPLAPGCALDTLGLLIEWNPALFLPLGPPRMHSPSAGPSLPSGSRFLFSWTAGDVPLLAYILALASIERPQGQGLAPGRKGDIHPALKDVGGGMYPVVSVGSDARDVSSPKQYAQVLTEALKTNSTMVNLKLRNNSTGDDGARALSEALKTNSTLTTLNLRLNSIGDNGAQALSEAPKTNSTLASVDLQINSIGESGAQALSEALKTDSTLTTLNLDHNSIGDNVEFL